MKLAAEMNAIVIWGSPVANMWCTQTPKPIRAVPSSAEDDVRVADHRPPARASG